MFLTLFALDYHLGRDISGSPQEEEDEFVELTVGGQACEFPQMYVVNLELVKYEISQLIEDSPSELDWEIIHK
ncbi:hypothetical protein AMS62_11965 [Bacillus sp. FJAT-18019]|nr:hypothetical protein AMS62_11965 [Bacillus sp. FJAT-18019]